MSNEADGPVRGSDEGTGSIGESIAGVAEAAGDASHPKEGGRLRRPSSLRASAPFAPASAPVSGEPPAPKPTTPPIPRKPAPLPSARKLKPPQFPGKLTPPPFLRRDSKPQAQPRSTDPVAAEAGPPQEAGPSPSQKLVTLVSERPQVGLGIAFAAGLVIATILKRLAR